MRALYLEDIQIEEKISELKVDSVQFDHLKKVARVREGEHLLILNGLGNLFYGKLLKFNRKTITFELETSDKAQANHNISLALLMPKKDAFEEIVQKAIQLGIRNIFTLNSRFAQTEFSQTNSRLNNIMVSAYQQSNNPFKLNIHPTDDLKVLSEIVKNFDKCVYFTSQTKTNQPLGQMGFDNKILFLVGPEGGLTQDEEQFLESLNFDLVNMPLPIMRSPTAVCTGVGFIISNLSTKLDA